MTGAAIHPVDRYGYRMTNVMPLTIRCVEYVRTSREETVALNSTRRSVTTRGFWNCPGVHAVVLPTCDSGSLRCPDCPRCTEIHSTVKEMVPIGSNAFIWNVRSAWRVVAASPALSANTCTTRWRRIRSFVRFRACRVVRCHGLSQHR